MPHIPMSIATKLNPGCIEKTKAAFAKITNHKAHDMQNHMQRMGHMQCYHAWIQTVPIGDWLIEYWESEFSFNDFETALQSPVTEFDHWLKTLRAELTNNGLKQIKGFRKLIDYQLQDGIPYASILPILPGKTGLLLQYMDEVERERADERDSYMRNVGFSSWRTWIQEMADGEQFLLQYHLLSKDFEACRQNYFKENTDYRRFIHTLCLDITGFDFDNPNPWQKVKPICEIYADVK